MHRFNPTIATVLNKTGMIESEGYGLRKVYKLAKDNNIVITYKDAENIVQMNIQKTLITMI